MKTQQQQNYLPGVSVIIPVYNREKYLAECIQSVLDQEADFPVEIICPDDGSTDKSKEVALSFGTAVRWIDKPAECKDQGAGPTRNRGIEVAQYSYIAFLDSDDLFLPGHLCRLFHFLETHPEFAAAIDQLYGFGEDINKRWIMPYPDTDTVKLESVMLYTYFNPSVVMIRHIILDELEGPFYEALRCWEDIDLFLRILEKKHQIAILSEVGAGLREHKGRSVYTRASNTKSKWSYVEIAFHRAVARYPYPKKVLRKRKAIIQFRLAQDDLFDRKYLSAAKRLLHAFFLDPVRAIQTVIRRDFKYW